MISQESLDKMSEVFTELMKREEERKASRMIINTGKQGVIKYLESVWKSNGLSEEDINKNISDAKNNLKDGIYSIDTNTIQNLGIKFHGSNL